MRRRLGLAGVSGLLVLMMLLPGGGGAGAVGNEPAAFAYGVASGEVTASAATLWTRALHSPVRVDVSPTATFNKIIYTANIAVSSADDETVHHRVNGLRGNKQYWFRFYDGVANQYSRKGTFRTAPRATQDVDVHLVWTGDSDGWLNPATGLPAFNNFETLDAARYSGASAFIYLGDTIYSDSSFSPFGPADTLNEYRQAYRQNRGYQSLRDLMANMSTYMHWDDHEVRNDWDADTVDPNLRALGTDAFQEWSPGATADPNLGFYRKYRWGKNVEFFILDERSFRDAEAHDSGACNNPQPNGPPDLAPNMPQGIRNLFAGVVPQLANPVPAGCLVALNDPTRSLLGAAQKARFKADLLASQAKFKIVFSGDPIQNQYVLPYDRWEGYLAERAEILNFITGNAIGGVVFLATDQHDNITNDVHLDLLNLGAGTDTGIDEMIVGPIATNTFSKEIIAVTGSASAPGSFVAFENLLLGAECASIFSINTYAWGDILYDAGTQTLTIQQKAASGAPVCPPLVLS